MMRLGINKTMKETEKIAKDMAQPNENTLPTEEELELRFLTAYLEGMDSFYTFIIKYVCISAIIITSINLYNLYTGKLISSIAGEQLSVFSEEFLYINFVEVFFWCLSTGFIVSWAVPLFSFFWDKLKKIKEKNS